MWLHAFVVHRHNDAMTGLIVEAVDSNKFSVECVKAPLLFFVKEKTAVISCYVLV